MNLSKGANAKYSNTMAATVFAHWQRYWRDQFASLPWKIARGPTKDEMARKIPLHKTYTEGEKAAFRSLLAWETDDAKLRVAGVGVALVDEAVRAAELDVLNIIANFSVRSVFLDGDNCQLWPVVMPHSKDGNGFAEQLTVSLFARLGQARKRTGV